VSRARILLADDEPAIVDSVRYALETEGMDVDSVADGREALAAADRDAYDVVILDIMMPELSGTEVLRRVRARSAVPILMLTAKDAEVDRVVGLELGADDYVTKPFSIVELVSRVRALLRRRELDRAAGDAVMRVGDLVVDARSREVTVAGRPVRLTGSEYKLLSLLTGAPGRVFSREELVSHLWGSEHVGDMRAADTHVVNLRRKVEDDPSRPQRIVTVRGVGYRLDAV
jgi:DNA-binding response OmpR family regulator